MGNFNMLPSEIMLEILSRVPAEYVVDCKCVSKPWRNLLQHPSFSQLHLNNLNGRSSVHDSGDLLCAYYHHCNGSWELWSLKKCKNYQDVIWSKEFNDFSHTRVEPITFTKSGGLLYYDYGDNNVYLYAAEASFSRMLVSFGVNFESVVPHKNTLVSLKALGEEETKQMNSCERGKFSRETEISDY
ncbi:F-box protein At2g23160-like [Papaver somniferum]|uniref:F-box protein At2g23160-like n=1 Tax=Papaver somniferum TaxID=3469 RepID=UPI000E6FBBCC|nr:F-box protein At2g23160-like [Papaver somniferum]